LIGVKAAVHDKVLENTETEIKLRNDRQINSMQNALDNEISRGQVLETSLIKYKSELEGLQGVDKEYQGLKDINYYKEKKVKSMENQIDNYGRTVEKLEFELQKQKEEHGHESRATREKMQYE
jgi:hypothetical protein